MKRHCTLVVTAALLLPGCAMLEWHKDGGTAETRDRDLAACAAKAQAEALRFDVLPPPQVTVDAQGRVIAVQPPRQDNQRFLAEQDLLRACMRERGYVLRESAAK
ncbi:MAG: hypothetical protein KF771_10445 [Burkholderiales bacterium]|nr:hypothetical protein [Burkholderiales bacterium]